MTESRPCALEYSFSMAPCKRKQLSKINLQHCKVYKCQFLFRPLVALIKLLMPNPKMFALVGYQISSKTIISTDAESCQLNVKIFRTWTITCSTQYVDQGTEWDIGSRHIIKKLESIFGFEVPAILPAICPFNFPSVTLRTRLQCFN